MTASKPPLGNKPPLTQGKATVVLYTYNARREFPGATDVVFEDGLSVSFVDRDGRCHVTNLQHEVIYDA